MERRGVAYPNPQDDRDLGGELVLNKREHSYACFIRHCNRKQGDADEGCVVEPSCSLGSIGVTKPRSNRRDELFELR